MNQWKHMTGDNRGAQQHQHTMALLSMCVTQNFQSYAGMLNCDNKTYYGKTSNDGYSRSLWPDMRLAPQTCWLAGTVIVMAWDALSISLRCSSWGTPERRSVQLVALVIDQHLPSSPRNTDSFNLDTQYLLSAKAKWSQHLLKLSTKPIPEPTGNQASTLGQLPGNMKVE